jgi:hypothetical protein
VDFIVSKPFLLENLREAIEKSTHGVGAGQSSPGH